MTKVQIGLCDALAKHFSITKATARKIAEDYLKEHGGAYPVIEFDLQDKINELVTIAVSKNTIDVGKMFFYRLVEKSSLHSDILNILGNTTATALAFYSGGAMMVVYQAEEYRGNGGIFVRDNRTGYVFEPIAHYLEGLYPKDLYYDQTVL